MAQLPRWLATGIIFPLLVLNGWALLQVIDYFQSPIRVFIIANLLAFILGYPLRWLQRRFRLKRVRAAILVILGVLVGVGIVANTIVPLLNDQIQQLGNSLPHWSESGRQQLQVLQGWASQRKLPIDFSGLAARTTDQFSNQLQSFAERILGFVVGAAGGVFELLLITIITFYLLIRGKPLWDGIFQWLPRHWRHSVRQELRRSFQNYYIGQATVAALLGVAMTVAFLLLRVPFGLLFGLTIGIMALFPFGGGLSITVVSVLVALNSFWLGVKMLAVALLIDQAIENGLAPRLLGRFTGVHPVWVLLSLMVGAKIAGLLGILLAVPCTSFLQNVCDRYRVIR